MTARAGLSRAEVLDRAVFALELAARSATPDTAEHLIRTSLDGLPAEDLQQVIACLASAAVRQVPAERVGPWLERLALEHLLSLKSSADPFDLSGEAGAGL
jgi:hypothetical protein